MKSKQATWTREEHILAFNLYCRIPFGKIHIHNPDIIKLAHLLGRTTGAVSYKLANFARLDPSLQRRGIRGMSHGAKGEEEVWREFSDHPDDLAYESERLLAERTGVSVEQLCKIDTADLPRIGEDRERIVKTRVNQYFFRQSVLSAYGYRCCITGLALPDLLIASHIIPWAVDVKNRLNPSNGLCLNALHDKAFDRGIISLTDDFKVVLNANERIFSDSDRKVIDWFLFYVGRPITKPSKFLPSKDLLAQHRRMHNLA